ncbi:MAG TPA: hypothetical protein VKB77_09715 [Terriglobales bacterium]|nr:hypothetical protein [Terriglobales bacterium]
MPRIRRSLAERGLLTRLRRSVLLPIHLMQEYRVARTLRPDGRRSWFDRAHGVDTDGDIASWTYLSDLNIDSPNWIDAGSSCALMAVRTR